MTEAPEILLAHHLKTLKLPTFLREYDKLARHCATEGLDHVRFLARLVELELIVRERRMIDLYRNGAIGAGRSFGSCGLGYPISHEGPVLDHQPQRGAGGADHDQQRSIVPDEIVRTG